MCISDSQDSASFAKSESRPGIQSTSSSVNKKSKKVKKQRNAGCNWSFGRPGSPSSKLSSEQEEEIKLYMKNIWFCTDISMKCLIYLCKKGNMVFKVKTGKPAEVIKKEFLEVFGKNTLKPYKKFKKDFRKNLKEKNIALLKHLGYSENTTYLFLGNNNGDQIDLKLEYVSNETKQGLLSLIKYLSPQFTYTYKVIVECFYSEMIKNQMQNQKTIVETIVGKLKSDKKNHQMIFNMQLIQELLLDDVELMNQIENQPETAYLYLRPNTSVNLPNFHSNSYKDQVDSIEEYSNWISNFVDEFVDILKQYP